MTFILNPFRFSAAAPGFPSVEGTQTTLIESGAGSHLVNLPAGVVTGELLIGIISHSGGSGDILTTPAGWSRIVFGNSNGVTQAAYARVADGAEGAQIDFVTATFTRINAIVYRISGHNGLTGVEAVATTVGSPSEFPDPAQLSASWGAADTLWIASCAINFGQRLTPGAPANYTNLIAMTAQASISSRHSAAVAQRAFNAASENPGSFDWSLDAKTANAWIAMTVAIRPAA
jgi:hypothetical protein